MHSEEYLPVSAAMEEASRLSAAPLDLSTWTVLRGLSVRARDAAIITAVCSVVAAVALPIFLYDANKFPVVVFSLVAAALMAYGGLRTSGLLAAFRVRRRVSRMMSGKGSSGVLDLVGFAQVSRMVSTSYASGGTVSSVRVHDHPATALSCALRAQESPSWWRASRPAARNVFFDGSAVRRDGPPESFDVLMEVCIDASQRDLISRLPAGKPIRVIGDESASMLVTMDSALFPRGRWIAGG